MVKRDRCVVCGEPRDNAQHCKKCTAKINKRRRELHAEMRIKGLNSLGKPYVNKPTGWYLK